MLINIAICFLTLKRKWGTGYYQIQAAVRNILQ